MRIISTFLPPSTDGPVVGSSILMVFDTLVDEKSVVVGLTVGEIQGGKLDDVRVSEVGKHVINRLAAHWTRNYPDGTFVIAGVAKVTGAKERVRHVLAKAPPGAGVLLVCANDKVYDAAFPALCVDYKSVNVGAQ